MNLLLSSQLNSFQIGQSQAERGMGDLSTDCPNPTKELD